MVGATLVPSIPTGGIAPNRRSDQRASGPKCPETSRLEKEVLFENRSESLRRRSVIAAEVVCESALLTESEVSVLTELNGLKLLMAGAVAVKPGDDYFIRLSWPCSYSELLAQPLIYHS